MNAELRESEASVRTEESTELAGLWGWLRRALPTAGVLMALIGIAVWGHLTEWEFGWHRRAKLEKDSEQSTLLATISYGQPIPSPATLPAVLRRQVRLIYPSAEGVEKAGIEVAPVWTAPMTDALFVSGELSFDPSRVARLASRARGAVWKVFKTSGAPVQTGEVLALIDAADVGKAKAELEQAIVQVRLRQKAVSNLRSAGSAVPERQVREAEAALREAEVQVIAGVQSLANLGLPVQATDFDRISIDEVVQRLRGLGVPANSGYDESTGTANLLPVRSPLSGVVLIVDAVVGEIVDPSRVIFVVVDPRRLWLTLHVPQEQARRVQNGRVVKFRPDGATADVVGKVTWIGSTADETTRTVPVRADVANEKGELRASTLGLGRIVVREAPNSIVVPRESVQVLQGAHIVFVRHPDFLKADGPKEFQIRVVRPGASDGTNIEILDGLQANEIVASKGANLLLLELTRLTQAASSAR